MEQTGVIDRSKQIGQTSCLTNIYQVATVCEFPGIDRKVRGPQGVGVGASHDGLRPGCREGVGRGNINKNINHEAGGAWMGIRPCNMQAVDPDPRGDISSNGSFGTYKVRY